MKVNFNYLNLDVVCSQNEFFAQMYFLYILNKVFYLENLELSWNVYIFMKKLRTIDFKQYSVSN